MTHFQNLHKIRNKIGNENQPRHKNVLVDLNNILNKYHLSHPYEMNDVIRNEFLENIHYSGGSNGLISNISNFEYLYRISTTGNLLNYILEWNIKEHYYDSRKDVFEYINIQYRKVSNWLNLSIFATGKYDSPRKITFWTTYDLSKYPLRGISKVGLVRDWISPFSIIMRLKVIDIKNSLNAKVPTSIDAFDSIIFDPTMDFDKPKYGKTIDIYKQTAFKNGTFEVVLNNIDVNLIDIKPIYISDKDRKEKLRKMDINLLFNLISFHSKLK